MIPVLTAELDATYSTIICGIGFATAQAPPQLHMILRLVSTLVDPQYESDPGLDLVGVGAIALDPHTLTLRVQFIAHPYDEEQHHRRVHFMLHVFAIIDQYAPIAIDPFPPDFRDWRLEYMDYYDRDGDAANRLLHAAIYGSKTTHPPHHRPHSDDSSAPGERPL
jgi:hypothetical protein